MRHRSLLVATLLLVPGSLGAQWSLGAAGIVGRLEHRVEAGYGVAASAGTVLGVTTRLDRGKLLELELHALGGRLLGDSLAGGDRRVGQLGLRGDVLVLPWLAFGATGTLRGYDAVAATQRWMTFGAGTEVRLDFADGNVQSVIRTSVLPYARISGQPAPDLGVSSDAGLQIALGRVVAGVEYTLERYFFPTAAETGGRREQLAGLLLRVGGRW